MSLNPILLSSLPSGGDSSSEILVYDRNSDQAFLKPLSELSGIKPIVNTNPLESIGYSFADSLKIYDIELDSDVFFYEDESLGQSFYSEVRYMVKNISSRSIIIGVKRHSHLFDDISIPAGCFLELSVSAYGLKRFALSKVYEV